MNWGEVCGWLLSAWVLGLAVAMFWVDRQSAKAHKRWMDAFSKRTNAKYGEGWEDNP